MNDELRKPGRGTAAPRTEVGQEGSSLASALLVANPAGSARWALSSQIERAGRQLTKQAETVIDCDNHHLAVERKVLCFHPLVSHEGSRIQDSPRRCRETNALIRKHTRVEMIRHPKDTREPPRQTSISQTNNRQT